MGLFGTNSMSNNGLGKSETKGILKKKKKDGIELKASSSWTDEETDNNVASQKNNKKAPTKAKFWRLHEDIAVENTTVSSIKAQARNISMESVTGKPRKTSTKTKNAKTFQRLDGGSNLPSPSTGDNSHPTNGQMKSFRPSPLKRPGAVGRKDKARPLHTLPSVDEHKSAGTTSRAKPIKIPSLRLRKPQRGDSPEMSSNSFAEYQPPEFKFGEFGGAEIPPPTTSKSSSIAEYSPPRGATDENRDKQKFRNFLHEPLQPCFSDDTEEVGQLAESSGNKGDQLGDIRPTESGSITHASEISGLYSESGFPTSKGGHNFQQIVFDNKFHEIQKVAVAQSDTGASDFSEFTSAAAKLTKQLSKAGQKKKTTSARKKKPNESPQRTHWPRLGEKKRDTPAYNKPTDSPLKKVSSSGNLRSGVVGSSSAASEKSSRLFSRTSPARQRSMSATEETNRNNENPKLNDTTRTLLPFQKPSPTLVSNSHGWPSSSQTNKVNRNMAPSAGRFEERAVRESACDTSALKSTEITSSGGLAESAGAPAIESPWRGPSGSVGSIASSRRGTPSIPVSLPTSSRSGFDVVQPSIRTSSRDQSPWKARQPEHNLHSLRKGGQLPLPPEVIPRSGFDIDHSWHQSRSLDESGFSVSSDASGTQKVAFGYSVAKPTDSNQRPIPSAMHFSTKTEAPNSLFEPKVRPSNSPFEPKQRTAAAQGFPFVDNNVVESDPFAVPQTKSSAVDDTVWNESFDPFLSEIEKGNVNKKSKMTSASSLDEGLIASIRSASAKKKGSDPEAHCQRDPSPRGVMLSSSDSALDKPRSSRSGKYSPGPQRIPPKAIPTNAILGSMLFRQSQPSNTSESAKSTSLRDRDNRNQYDETRDEMDTFGVPQSVIAARDDTESIVSSVTEEASSFYQKSFGGSHRSWNKQAHDLVSNYGVNRSSTGEKGGAPHSKACLTRLEEEHVKAFRSEV